jgi:hypothetical protein
MGQSTGLVDGAGPVNTASFSWTDYFQEGAVPHTASYAVTNGDLVRTYDGLSTVIGRNVGTISFSRSGRLIAAHISSTTTGRFSATEQKAIQAYLRSNPS